NTLFDTEIGPYVNFKRISPPGFQKNQAGKWLNRFSNNQNWLLTTFSSVTFPGRTHSGLYRISRRDVNGALIRDKKYV
ncbi:MAG: hypothetical protein V3R68_02425, partial [Gammaproteobacteria bacterium]